MSKFEELCRAYATSRKKYLDYKRICSEFASSLVNEMINYFQCPREQVKFIPLKGEIKYGNCSLTGAMHLDDDAFWHFGVELTLYEDPNTFPQETILLPLSIKKVDDYFIVKLGTYKKRYKIHKDNPDEFRIFYEFIFEQIKKSYKKGLQQFLGQRETSRKIGFDV